MKKVLITFILVCAALMGMAQYRCIPHLQEYGNPSNSYTLSNGYADLNINYTLTPVWSAAQSIGFPFYFNGQLVTHFKVSSTGVLSFDTTASTAPPMNNNVLPDPQIPDKSICIRGIGALTTYSKVFKYNYIYEDGPTTFDQTWVTFRYYSDTLIPGNTSSRMLFWSIVLEENTNKIYIVDQYHTAQNNLHLTLGIQLDASTAYMATGSPNITWHSGGAGSTYDGLIDVYYEFRQGMPLITDGALLASTIPQYTSIANAPFTVGTKFRNLGTDTVHSLQLHYTINGGAPITETFSGINIPCGNHQWFNFASLFNPASTGIYDIDIWADHINGLADEDTANNHFTQQIYMAPSLPPRRIMFEEFKGSGCTWSGYWTERYDSLLGLNDSKASSIKYECYFPSVLGCPDCSVREQFYDHYGSPFVFANGVKVNNGNQYFVGCPWNVTQTFIDSLYSLPGLFTVEPHLNINGFTANVTGTVTSNVNLFAGTPCKIYVSLVEDTIQFATPQGSSHETLFANTSRKLIPSGNGVFIGTPQLGHTDTLNFSYSFTDTTINTSRLRVVVFVQDTITREIYQCGEAAGVVDCPPVYHSTKYHLCNTGDSVYVDGSWINEYGYYPHHYYNSNGCDSLQLNIVLKHIWVGYIHATYNSQILQVAPNMYMGYDTYTYQWYDSTYQQIIPGATGLTYAPLHSGVYYVIVTNQVGCVYYSSAFNFHCSQNFQQSITLCSPDSVHVGTHWYAVAGTYKDTVLNASGTCDSVITTTITVTNINTTVNASIYAASANSGYPSYATSYQWIDCATGANIPGATTSFFNAPFIGDFKVNITVYGCTKQSSCVSLRCHSNSSSQNLPILCAGDSVLIFNNWHDTPGSFYDTLLTSDGMCDSIVYTFLSIPYIYNSISVNGYTATTYSNYSNYQWIDCTTGLAVPNANNYNFQATAAGIYKVEITNSAGCTSVSSCVSLRCFGSSASQNIFLCPGDSLQVGNIWHHTNGIYHDTLVNMYGCDSIINSYVNYSNVNAYLTVNGNTATSYAFNSNFQWYDCATSLAIPGANSYIFHAPYAGDFRATFNNTIGCSGTTACVSLTSNCATTFNQQSLNLCHGDSVNVGNHWYTTSGTYTDTTTALDGCFIINTTQITETLLDTVVVLSNNSLIAPAGYVQYNWIDCANGLTLQNSNSHEFVPTFNGSFKVSLTDSAACSAESACMPFIITGNKVKTDYAGVLLYPNPGNGVFTFMDSKSIKYVEVFNLLGEKILNQNNQQQINLSEFANGIYFARINGEVLVKLVKE